MPEKRLWQEKDFRRRLDTGWQQQTISNIFIIYVWVVTICLSKLHVIKNHAPDSYFTYVYIKRGEATKKSRQRRRKKKRNLREKLSHVRFEHFQNPQTTLATLGILCEAPFLRSTLLPGAFDPLFPFIMPREKDKGYFRSFLGTLGSS